MHVCGRAEAAQWGLVVLVVVELICERWGSRKNLGLEGVELINLYFGEAGGWGEEEERQNLCQEAQCFGKVCNFMQIEKSHFLL